MNTGLLTAFGGGLLVVSDILYFALCIIGKKNMQEATTEHRFISRPDLIDFIRKALHSAGHIVLGGQSGMGKSQLLHEFVSDSYTGKSSTVLHIDLTDVVHESDLLIAIAGECIRHVDTSQVKVMKEFANAFTYLRPVVRYDGFSQAPKVDFSIDDDVRYEVALDQLFGYAGRMPNLKLVTIEHLERIHDDGIRSAFKEALLRNVKCKTILTVDDGIQRDRLRMGEIWPFDKQTPCVRVDAPEEHLLLQEIQKQMNGARKKIDQAASERLIEWSRGEVDALSQAIGKLIESPRKQIDEWTVEAELQQILQERAPFFRTYRDLLTRNQWMLLRGIARERGAIKVMGSAFVRKYALGTPSSVQTALAALQEKDLVYEAGGRWWLYDTLLSRWLEQH
jgi:hypothetical protein